MQYSSDNEQADQESYDSDYARRTKELEESAMRESGLELHTTPQDEEFDYQTREVSSPTSDVDRAEVV